MSISMGSDEQERFYDLWEEIRGLADGDMPAARATQIPYSTWVGLGKGARPLLVHAWGFARGLSTLKEIVITPEQVVAQLRGVEIPTGKRSRTPPLVDQIEDAPLRVQLECFELLSEILVKRLEEAKFS